MSMSKIFYVFGNYGTMKVEIGTGNVIDYEWDNPNEKYYSDIARIDIRKFEKTFGQPIEPEDKICIMDCNYSLYNGQYLVPDSPYTSDKDDLSQPIIVIQEPIE